ncbi:hypothetical protein DL96DRAFT_1825177 [Flagelloscypha sp. PMI_526]|nr:hypothetical protein DL96DRAFT_1825177 [Flagelloscypha sp. PMI_526]
MQLSLPPEIWAYILACLPDSSLHVIKHVNHTFSQICRDLLCRVLDLALNLENRNLEKHLGNLSNRLQEAKSRPLLVKKLCLGPSVKVQGDHIPKGPSSSAQPISKSFQFLRRIFNTTDPSAGPISSHQALTKARKIEVGLSVLMPSLLSIEELEFNDPIGCPAEWSFNANLVLNQASTRLTVLSLRFSLSSGLSRTFYTFNGYGDITLPALRTFRLRRTVSPDDSEFEFAVQRLISASPLLLEIQYHMYSHDSHGVHGPLRIPANYSHHHLKSFKFTAAVATALGTTAPLAIPSTPLFTAHAAQFELVHLNPVHSLEGFRLLNISQLTELRVDLYVCDKASQFFAYLAHAVQLVTLEITGYMYTTAECDPAYLFPVTGLSRLRRLYLGICLGFFSPRKLRMLSSKTPNLRTLALLAEPWSAHWTYVSLADRLNSLVSDFRCSELLTWTLSDFGIILRVADKPESSEISHFEQILKVICRRVPSITSFYGTGSLHVWDGMETEIEESWGGELWRKRHGKW